MKDKITNQEWKPKVYKDFDDYWRHGNHGCSSGFRDIAKDIWDEFWPTINASRSDWEKVLIEECLDQRMHHLELLQNVYAYLKKFDSSEYARSGSKVYV